MSDGTINDLRLVEHVSILGVNWIGDPLAFEGVVLELVNILDVQNIALLLIQGRSSVHVYLNLQKVVLDIRVLVVIDVFGLHGVSAAFGDMRVFLVVVDVLHVHAVY